MAFYGCQFSFDGVPCFEYGLMVYDIGGANENGKFSSSASEIIEDRTAWRNTPLHYGVTQNTPLVFTFTFGADIESVDNGRFFDRWEMSVIANWLTGHTEYKYLEITQPDMETIRYKCIITELEYVTYGKFPWAFQCTVTCDSPFAYTYPEVASLSISDSITTSFNNRASCTYYYPKIVLTVTNGTSFSIVNHSDNDREFLFSGLSALPLEISIDNENEIITNNRGINLYPKFNYNFFRLVRGYNNLEISCRRGTIQFTCEYPINIGG